MNGTGPGVPGERSLEDVAYLALTEGLKHILRTSGAIMVDSEIRSLNVGLCLVQCGLVDHPLVKSMALSGKKRYLSNWENSPELTRMLESWLFSEVLLRVDDKDTYRVLADSAILFTADYMRGIKSEVDEFAGMLAEKDIESTPDLLVRSGIFNWYTFFMAGHLARNLFLASPHSRSAEEALDIARIFTVAFLRHCLDSGSTGFMDFAVATLAGIEDRLPDDALEVRQKSVGVLLGILDDPAFWDIKDHNVPAHFLLDLAVAGELPEKWREEGIRNLSQRIWRITSSSPADLQALTRVVRTLGELATAFPDMPDKLELALSPVYSRNILDEIKLVVLDEGGYKEDGIVKAVSCEPELQEERDQDGEAGSIGEKVKAVLELPLRNPGFHPKPELEFIDIVKKPSETMEHGGDCDCLAAMYASLLLAAGFRHVETYHLRKIFNKEDGGEETLFHAVACVPDPPSEDENLYCLDLDYCLDRETRSVGEVPRVKIIDNNIAIIEHQGEESVWALLGRRVLVSSGDRRRPATRGPSVTSGAHIHPRRIALNPGAPTWILLHRPDRGGVSDTLWAFLVENLEHRSKVYDDFLVAPGDGALDQCMKKYGLRFGDVPALILACQEEDGQELVAIIKREDLKNIRKVYGDSGMVEKLQDLSNEFVKVDVEKVDRLTNISKLRAAAKDIFKAIGDFKSITSWFEFGDG